jgi:hypothetical protein
MCLNFLLCLNFWPFVLLFAFSEAFLCIHLVYLGCAPLCFSMNYYLSNIREYVEDDRGETQITHSLVSHKNVVTIKGAYECIFVSAYHDKATKVGR